jgi:hypothetical protein
LPPTGLSGSASFWIYFAGNFRNGEIVPLSL